MADPSLTHSVAPNNTENDGKQSGDSNNSQYIAFVVVPVFFLLGLLGVLICHVLKRKGYRCTTDAEKDAELEEEEEKHLEEGDLNDTYSEGNTDTVGQIVHYIMKNEANTDALKAMVTENSIDSDGAPVTPTSPTTPVSPVSPRTPPSAAKHTCNHLHTIGGMGGQKNICSRCNHKKWPLMRRGSNKKMDRRSHIGEVTVLSVGRFRVTKSDPRPPVRRTLLITEPNGSVPASPGKTEAAALSSTTEAQPQADGSDKK